MKAAAAVRHFSSGTMPSLFYVPLRMSFQHCVLLIQVVEQQTDVWLVHKRSVKSFWDVCWEIKHLPRGCRSGRSAWRCCSPCKSTDKETKRSTLGLSVDLRQEPPEITWLIPAVTGQSDVCEHKTRHESHTNESRQLLHCSVTDTCGSRHLWDEDVKQ